jgi:hypothetical protein
MREIWHGLLFSRNRRRSHLFVVLAAACALSWLGLPRAAAQEDTRQQAKALFESGVQFYDKGEYAKALQAFQEAYRLHPHPVVRVNMANCYDRMNKPIEAIFHFERFLEESEDDVKPAKRNEVTAALKRLRRKVGQVQLRVVPDGVSIRIDDAEKRQSPVVEPLLLVAGEHFIEARLEGYRPVRRSINVAGGDITEISITMQTAEDGAAAPAAVAGSTPGSAAPAAGAGEPSEALVEELAGGPEPQPVEAEREPIQPAEGRDSLSKGTPVLIAGAATVALAVATTVTGVMALAADADYDFLSEKSYLTDAERTDAEQTAARADDLALASDILLGATAVGAAVTIYLLLSKERPPDASGSASTSAWMGPGGAGIALTGSL